MTLGRHANTSHGSRGSSYNKQIDLSGHADREAVCSVLIPPKGYFLFTLLELF